MQKSIHFMPMLFVKTGKTIVINTITFSMVSHLKHLIQEKEGISVSEQQLEHGGKQIGNGHTLSNYNIQKESTLHLNL